MVLILRMQAARSSQLWSVHCYFVPMGKSTPTLDDQIISMKSKLYTP